MVPMLKGIHSVNVRPFVRFPRHVGRARHGVGVIGQTTLNRWQLRYVFRSLFVIVSGRQQRGLTCPLRRGEVHDFRG